MFYIFIYNNMIRDESYIHIGGWMLNKLNLKGNELIVYATIYSFTNGTDEHCYKGSAGYLSERCGLQRRQIMNILKSLKAKGYIESKERTENGIKFVDYYTPYANIAQGGYANFTHHNTSNDNNSSKKNKTLPLNNITQKLANICKGDLTFTENVIERLEEYNNTRKKKLEKLTDKGFKLVIDKLVELGHGTEDGMIAVLKQSVENGWEGLFEVKGYKPKVDYEKDLGLFLTRLKTDYEGLKKELGNDKFFELKKKALEYGAVNKLL